jgi:enoyl-CoA hydratase
MHEYKSIRYEIEGQLARLTLNRPELLNAIDDEMHNDLLSVLLEIRGEPEIRAVLFGAEGKTFSAGGDLNEVASLQADIAKRTRMCETGLRIIHALLDIPVPIVVALHGDAMGLGASIVLGCDIIVASCLFWPASVGMHRAKRYLLTGDLMPAEDAWKFGLVTDLVDTPEECLPAARKIAERITGLPPIAVRGTKQSLNALLKSRARETFDLSMAYELQSGGSEDILEAVKAFKEKRKPVYRNR